MKPFAWTPGRDVSKDRPAPFDVARSYYDQRFEIAEDAPRLRQLLAAVNCPGDLGSVQWGQWYSVALGFEPDLILELGRGYGNSTAVFAEAAYRLQQRQPGRPSRVVSLCGTGEWASVVTPRLVPIVDRHWFANVDARRIDILSVDYSEMLRGSERVLVLWDAHGFDIAEVVLGDILPRLADRPHLVLMHDISDNRYPGVSRSYGGQPLWKGSEWQERTGRWDSRVNIGWMNSRQNQVIALADFGARNDLEIESADHEYARLFGAHDGWASEMRRLLGSDLFSLEAGWAFLSLNGKEGPFHYPAVSGGRAATNRGGIVADLPSLPATIATGATPWAYAARVPWRAAAEPPANVNTWVRCRLRVEGGPIGVSLLSADEGTFVGSQVVSQTAEPVDVLLLVPDLARHGPLVIHTWDAPESARVRIDDLALVW